MAGKVVARVAFGDKGAELNVLPSHFLTTHVIAKDAFKFLMAGGMIQLFYFLHLLLVHIVLDSLQHTIEGYLCCIGNEGENGMCRIVSDGLENGLSELFAQLLALQIDVAVAATAEIDALKRTRSTFLRFNNLAEQAVAMLIDNECLPRGKFLDVVTFKIESSLKHRTLTGQNHYFVVAIVERRPDTPRITHGKQLAATRQPTNDITTVKVRHCRSKHILHLYMILDVVGDVQILHLHGFCCREITFDFTV